MDVPQGKLAQLKGKTKKKKKKLKPVSIAGIEFDALIDQQKTLSATIPAYPVEEGFPVSDTIILDPLTLQMTLYVTNTPVTWLKRHGASRGRVNEVSNKIEDMWMDRKLVKIVTPDAIYTNMGITSITIKKSAELGYSREVSVTAQKVRKTRKKTVKVPKYKLKSGQTKTKTGKSQTSPASKRSGSSNSTASSSTTSGSAASSSSSSSASSRNASSSNSSKKSQSILYGVAKGLKFL